MDGKEKKGKGKKSQSQLEFGQGGKKKDFSKIKCFHCHELRCYAMKFTPKTASKKTTGEASSEALASQFELDFTLIACMESTMMGSVWYLDSGASFHMTNNKEFFGDLKEKDL